MKKDSIEALLSRHYGSEAITPAGLEERLYASVQREALAQRNQQLAALRIGERRLSRRSALKLVAIGTTGLSLLSMGMEGLQAFEASVLGQDLTQSANP